MPSLLNPYNNFFHCAGEEFQYEMDVANEVVDYSLAANSSRTTASTPPRRMVSQSSNSMVGAYPPSPASSVDEFRTEQSALRHVRKASRS